MAIALLSLEAHYEEKITAFIDSFIGDDGLQLFSGGEFSFKGV